MDGIWPAPDLIWERVGDSYVKITNTLNVGMEWMKTVRVLQMDGCEF
jgi:hypothetical protein